MIGYHGTDKDFEKFEKNFILSGEGLIKRGFGMNFTLDKNVAKHYFESSGKDDGYIIEAALPEMKDLLSLDDCIYYCITGRSLFSIAESIAEKKGVDLQQHFDEACEDEEISNTYSDSLAEEMFERVVINNNDFEAIGELKEWSPGYDWDSFIEEVKNVIGFEFDEYNTGEDLHNYLCSAMGGADKAAEFLERENVKGTYGHETLSNEQDKAFSLVVFSPDDIVIRNKERIESEQKPKNKQRKMRP